MRSVGSLTGAGGHWGVSWVAFESPESFGGFKRSNQHLQTVVVLLVFWSCDSNMPHSTSICSQFQENTRRGDCASRLSQETSLTNDLLQAAKRTTHKAVTNTQCHF